MAIKSIIIDDENLARRNLKFMLEESDFDVQVIGQADSAISGAKAIRDLRPDLVFLDIQMSGGSGFEMLDIIEKINFDIIFVTAHEEFALKAFKYDAVDYIMKPIDLDDLNNAIKKHKKRSSEKAKQIHRLELVKSLSLMSSKVPIPHKDGVKFLEIDDVIRLEADGSYTTVFSNKEKPQVVSKPLKFYATLLSEVVFVRVHRSHLINIKYIKEYKRDAGGFVVLHNNDMIHVAEMKRDMVLRRLSES